MSQSQGVVDPLFEPTNPEFVTNPFPHYERLRAEAPVHHSPLGFWIISRYEDVMELLRDPNLSREVYRYSPAYRASHAGSSEAWNRFVANQVQFLDPPDHSRQRRLVAKAFTPMAIEARRPAVEHLARHLLAPALITGEVELIEALARPLPYRVICELLGLDPGDARMEPTWITSIVRGLSTIVTEKDMQAASAALDQVSDLIAEAIEDHRRHPRRDLLTALIEAEDVGERLNTEELFALTINLLVGGSETTMNLIGSSIYSLLRFPDQRTLLRAEPALVKNAVEESLRLESPAQFQSRTTIKSFRLRDVEIPGGATIYLALGSANRDPSRWPDPDRFDIQREGLQHLAFGYGIHHCLGASLARLETSVAIATVLDLPNLRLLGPEPGWGGTAAVTQRGLKHLHLHFDPIRS